METASPARILIRHLSGSKINQIEQFDLKDLTEITIGRDPTSNITYDVKRDDLVSRKHAVIRIKNDKELYFRLADLNSSNGTLLNGERISGEVELLPNDEVELGPGGPKFGFDIQPRPMNLPERTRQMSAVDAAATRLVAEPAIAATQEHAAAPVAITTERTNPGSKVSVGHATLQRALHQERRRTGRVWLAALAATVVLAAGGLGALYWHNQTVAKRLEQAAADQAQQLANENQKLAAAVTAVDTVSKQAALTPERIRSLGESTVYIENRWTLYDQETGHPLFQRMVTINGKRLPAFVRTKEGVVRWLTLQDEDGSYRRIGEDQSGSGFVIGEQGFILTNKHIAGAWQARYEDYSSGDMGAVYNLDAKPSRRADVLAIDQLGLPEWKPESGGYVFEPTRPIMISGRRAFFGRNEKLTVQFPGTRMSINATLLRTSTADVAEVKVDSSQPLTKLELVPDNYSVQAGMHITLLGYPGLSQKTYAFEQRSEGTNIKTTVISVPEPTVSEGIVSRLPSAQKEQGDVTTRGDDNYQLDIFASYGHSGGPVLNTEGKVLGLLVSRSTRDSRVAYAVPVRYVRELIQPQRNAASP